MASRNASTEEMVEELAACCAHPSVGEMSYQSGSAHVQREIVAQAGELVHQLGAGLCRARNGSSATNDRVDTADISPDPVAVIPAHDPGPPSSALCSTSLSSGGRPKLHFRSRFTPSATSSASSNARSISGCRGEVCAYPRGGGGRRSCPNDRTPRAPPGHARPSDRRLGPTHAPFPRLGDCPPA